MSNDLTHLRPLVDAMAFEVRAAVEGIGGQVADATRAGVRVNGAEARPVATAAGGAAPVTSVRGRWMGYLLAEITGTDGVRIRFHDGDSIDGDIIGSVTLAAGESVRDYFGPGGVAITRGLFLELLPSPGQSGAGGAIDGAVFLTAGD